METPSSARRVTRSQSTRKYEDSESNSKQRNTSGKPQFDRSPLIDITNDSPIVGLAFGGMGTPSSAMSKKRFSCPGSGEALLRGQVKNLLQKVEEEAELSKLTVENRSSLQVKGFIRSPMAFAAPTPANTPQILSLSANGSNQGSNAHPMEEECVISQVVGDIFDANGVEGDESENNLMITRSLMQEFSEKSEVSSCLSEVTIQEGDSESKENTTTAEDDDMSVWSIQVNVSTQDEEEEEDYNVVRGVLDEVEEVDDYSAPEEDDEGIVDELCAAISQINVNGAGKHTRFVYNSDDELEGEMVEDGGAKAAVPLLNLRGLPASTGKHLRFPDD